MADNGHYYTLQAEPAHEGGLAQARINKHVPSVTTIMAIINKEGINSYRVRSMLEAALTLPRQRGETDDDFISRLYADADQARSKAAEVGSLFHSVLESYFKTGEFNTRWLPPQYYPTAMMLKETVDNLNLTGNPEVSFASHRYGYGGTVDLIAIDDTSVPVIVDYKTQDVKEALKSGLPKFVFYPEWASQLAAYRAAISDAPDLHRFTQARCISLAISTNPNIPGCKVKVWKETAKNQMSLRRGWEVFIAATALYYAKHDLTIGSDLTETCIKDCVFEFPIIQLK